MKNLNEANILAQVEGTEASTKFRKTARIVIRAIIGLIVIAIVSYIVVDTVQIRREKAATKAIVVQSTLQRSKDDCTYARPCTPAQYTDGSTERVAVPENKRVCFDPPVWSDLEGVGFIVASKGQKEHRYACSVDEAAQGRCTEAPIVTFRFVPKPGVIPPRHWFTDKPDLIC